MIFIRRVFELLSEEIVDSLLVNVFEFCLRVVQLHKQKKGEFSFRTVSLIA